MEILGSILACVSSGLDNLYPDYPVFTELVPDELPERCFLIGFAGDVEINHSLGSRYEVKGKVDITYISPKRENSSKQENNAVFSTISLRLRHLKAVGIKIRLEKHRRRDVDDVLHDICDFHTFLYQINDTPYIGSITQHPQLKE